MSAEPMEPRGQGAPAAVLERAAPPPGKGQSAPLELSRIRRTMARLMAQTVSIPTFYLRSDVDLSTLLALRQQMCEQASGQRPPSINDFVVAACSKALRSHPLLNCCFAADGPVSNSRINVGVALSANGELLVPTVYDADAKPAQQIALQTRALIAQAPKFTIDELRDSTFTVSNLGMYGVQSFDAIVNPPQVAILAVGAMRTAQVPQRSTVMQLSLGCDHRVLTGTDGAQFLAEVIDLLQQRPSSLIAAGEGQGEV